MRNYTIPLKLLIAEYIGADLEYLRFELANGKAIYTIHLKGECLDNNRILASHNEKVYHFGYDTKIKYIGRYMVAIWDYWKHGGSKIFNDWIYLKTGQSLNQCVRDSCTYHANDNRCVKNFQNECSYKLLR